MLILYNLYIIIIIIIMNKYNIYIQPYNITKYSILFYTIKYINKLFFFYFSYIIYLSDFFVMFVIFVMFMCIHSYFYY